MTDDDWFNAQASAALRGYPIDNGLIGEPAIRKAMVELLESEQSVTAEVRFLLKEAIIRSTQSPYLIGFEANNVPSPEELKVRALLKHGHRFATEYEGRFSTVTKAKEAYREEYEMSRDELDRARNLSARMAEYVDGATGQKTGDQINRLQRLLEASKFIQRVARLSAKAQMNKEKVSTSARTP